MTTLKVITIGNALGVVLPKEILERLQVEEGDCLNVVDTPQGIELPPLNLNLLLR